ncbi:MAG: DMT family transporter [Leptolyngbyaceae bacterium]|nr:DMT family transporter [Leptolyngbyaceae bacterium]
MSLANPPTRWYIGVVLTVGVLCISTSAILVRLALDTGAEAGVGLSLVLAASRLCFASLVLIPTWKKVYTTSHQREALIYSAIAGILLAIHFASWITSLAFTSIAASTTLVTTNPIWVALISWLWLRERPSPRTLLGIAITITGSIIVSLVGSASSSIGENPLLGNGLALVGSWSFSLYFLLGRAAQRRNLSLHHHAAIAYTIAAVVLLPIPLLTGHAYGDYPAEVYGYAALMALIPQLIGHTTLNWAVNHIPPTLVTLTILLEPIGASLLGYLAFQEVPTVNVWIGAIIIIAGVAIAVLGKSRAPQPEISPEVSSESLDSSQR